jgi:hypothetical protein
MSREKKFLEPQNEANSYFVISHDGSDDISLEIGDCNRHINLSFSYGGNWTGRTKAQALAKLTRLEKALAHVREAIEQA